MNCNNNVTGHTFTRCCLVALRVPHLLLLREGCDPPDQAGDPRVDPRVVGTGASLPEADDADLGVPGNVYLLEF